NGFTIRIPPLRDREADIALLLDWFLARYRKELGKDVQGFSPEALELMLNYAWPGNVRQLQSVLKQAIVQATSPVLMAEL
ncbi:two-component system response regulator, partial [Klebsiella pneumoniae]|nr:two-component system response regulator [Klebsiella pneumoniae]